GYPAVICASPNSMIVHGIPSPDIVLRDGDIISIDCGAIIDGWHGDAAFTAPVGDVEPEMLRMIEVAEASLAAAIAVTVDGGRIGDIGHAVQTTVETAGLEVVREYTGHAIGQAMHEQPSIPNLGRAGTGPRLRVGNVLAIEPMVVLGDPETDVLDDQWSVVTADGAWSAHVEHTVAITDDGPEILTVSA
ncbi:MAG TPA: type I methionyl aminopeptidase, partial [Acidimicrobiales bacterium]